MILKGPMNLKYVFFTTFLFKTIHEDKLGEVLNPGPVGLKRPVNLLLTQLIVTVS